MLIREPLTLSLLDEHCPQLLSFRVLRLNVEFKWKRFEMANMNGH